MATVRFASGSGRNGSKATLFDARFLQLCEYKTRTDVETEWINKFPSLLNDHRWPLTGSRVVHMFNSFTMASSSILRF